MQGLEIELGGFKGRTNKLVDGCYSWWCGGSFSLLESLGVSGSPFSELNTTNESKAAGTWDDIDGEAISSIDTIVFLMIFARLSI